MNVISLDESTLNEGEVLTLASSFKEIVNKKNEEILNLKKILIMCYSLFRMIDEEIDGHDLVERGRSICSDALDKYIIKED
jgi:hypothetical protein